MKQKKENISRILVLLVLLALASAPQSTLLRRANAQDRNINVNERIDLNALGINNEVQRIVSLLDAQAKFFKRAAELKQSQDKFDSPGYIRDRQRFREEAEQRKVDVAKLQREFQSLIDKLKRGNRWNETFDAQVLASLKNASDRTVVSQFGGARKVFQAAVDEVLSLREDIDDEVRQVTSKQQGRLHNRGNRVFAAHASPVMVKVGCNLLFSCYLIYSLVPGGDNSLACVYADRYNDKGCTPRIGGCD